MDPISSPTYTSDSGNGGENAVSPACQYLVVVSPARLGGGVFVYQMQQPLPINGNPNAQLVASGGFAHGASVQAFQPGSTEETVTLEVSEP